MFLLSINHSAIQQATQPLIHTFLHQPLSHSATQRLSQSQSGLCAKYQCRFNLSLLLVLLLLLFFLILLVLFLSLLFSLLLLFLLVDGCWFVLHSQAPLLISLPPKGMIKVSPSTTCCISCCATAASVESPREIVIAPIVPMKPNERNWSSMKLLGCQLLGRSRCWNYV